MLSIGSVSLVMVVLAAAGTAGDNAETTPVEVEFDGPAGCSGANDFLTSLLSRTRRVREAAADQPRTKVQVRLRQGHGRVTGELRIVDNRGGTDTRRVQGGTCDEVVQALSLTTALALDPSVRSTAPPADPGTDAAATGATAPPTLVRSEKNPSAPAAVETAVLPTVRTSRPVPDFEWNAGFFGLTVISGSMDPGIGMAARKNFGRDGGDNKTFRPTLGFAAIYLRNDVLQSPQAAAVTLAAIEASGCPMRLTASFFTLRPCAFVLAGWLSATGLHVAHANTVDHLWLSSGLTLRAELFIGRGFSLDLEGGVNAPWLRRNFFASLPSNVVAGTPTLSPMARVGLTYGR